MLFQSMMDLFLVILATILFGLSFYRYSHAKWDKYAIGLLLAGVYVGALTRPVVYIPGFSILLIGVTVGMAGHEYAHYFTSLIWMNRKNVNVNLRHMYVRYDSPHDAPPWGIRLIAAMPYLLMIFIVLTLFSGNYRMPFTDFERGALSVTNWFNPGFIIGLGLGVSPSDVLAILYPRIFQNFASYTEESDIEGAWELLKSQIKINIPFG